MDISTKKVRQEFLALQIRNYGREGGGGGGGGGGMSPVSPPVSSSESDIMKWIPLHLGPGTCGAGLVHNPMLVHNTAK